jgi:hypothetical protein
MIYKLKNLSDEIHALLEMKEAYRDDDAKLVCAYYFQRLGGANLERMNAIEFLHLLAGGRIPFPDNITRVRRKLQEKHPELRGKEWGKRHILANEVRQNIGDL